MRKIYTAICLIAIATLLIGCTQKEINSMPQVDEEVDNNEGEKTNGKELTITSLSTQNAPFNADNQLFEFLNYENYQIEKYKQDCDDTQEYYESSIQAFDKWKYEICSFSKLPNETKNVFQDYMDECKMLNSYIYSTNCMYAGSMYIPVACDQFNMKCELLYGELLSVYPENISEYPGDEIDDVDWINYEDTLFTFEYSNDFEDLLNGYKLDEKSISELRNIITNECESLDDVNNEFDFSNYGKYCLLTDDELIKLEYENKIDESIIEKNEKNRLENYITELVSLRYLIDC